MENKDGTQASGFVTNEQNKPPRQCGNCIWNDYGFCNNDSVKNDPELHPSDNGMIKIKPTWCCDYFQSKGNVILYIIRHGDTKNNDENKFRGWIDIPLNTKGRKQATVLSQYFKDQKLKEVYSSNLIRAVETAKIATSKNPTKDKDLRPWDVGIFSGKDKDKYQEQLNYYIDNPDVEIPQGESLKQFSDRQSKVLNKYLTIAKENGPILLAVHSSNTIQFEKIIEGKDELGRPEDVDRVTPGGLMVVLDQGGQYKIEVVLGVPVEEPANYGS